MYEKSHWEMIKKLCNDSNTDFNEWPFLNFSREARIMTFQKKTENFPFIFLNIRNKQKIWSFSSRMTTIWFLVELNFENFSKTLSLLEYCFYNHYLLSAKFLGCTGRHNMTAMPYAVLNWIFQTKICILNSKIIVCFTENDKK